MEGDHYEEELILTNSYKNSLKKQGESKFESKFENKKKCRKIKWKDEEDKDELDDNDQE